MQQQKVLEPPSLNKNIFEIVSGMDNFSILTSLLDTTGLATVLAGKGPLTLFAPSDSTFHVLPQGALEFLLLDESIDVLTTILKYHMLATNGESRSLTSETMTLSGDTLSISVDENTVNDSEVAVADIISSNGIVHILDSILLPPGVSISDFVTTVPTQILEEEGQNGINEVAEGEDQSQTSTILAEAGDEESESSAAGDGKGNGSAAAPVATSDVSGSKSCKPATPCLLGLAFGLAFLVN